MLRLSRPRNVSARMQYHRLELLINLHDGYRKVFKIDANHLMLVQLEGQRYLIESFCPHRAYPLAESDLQGDSLVCPQHGYRFDLATGAVLYASEEPCRALRRYELVYEGNEVGVML